MIARDEVSRRVERFVTACRQQGLKATHQRREILRELAETDEHPDVETVYTRVRRRIPAISLDTVYRTLRLLEEKGVIARVGSVIERARYDANMGRHHHFVCCACGMIGDFCSDVLDRFPVPRAVAAMGSVEGVYVELRGRCRKCEARAKKARNAIGGNP
jgi:Fur family transcriptional regulator, peroxide stress response regulator